MTRHQQVRLMSVSIASHSNLTMHVFQIDPGERKLSLSTDIQGEYYGGGGGGGCNYGQSNDCIG